MRGRFNERKKSTKKKKKKGKKPRQQQRPGLIRSPTPSPSSYREAGELRSAILSGSVVLTRGEEKVAEIDDSLWAVHTL